MKKLLTFAAALLFAGAMFGQQATSSTTTYKGVANNIKPLKVKATLAQPKRETDKQEVKAQNQKQVAPDNKATIKEKSTKETSGSK